MKNLLIASAMAVVSVMSFAPQLQAASVTVITDERPGPRHHADYYRHRPRHHDCMVKKVKTYRHGHVVIKETRVCR